MSDKELRKQNNAKIQGSFTGMNIRALLSAAEGNSNTEVEIVQDEITIKRSYPPIME